MIDEVNAIQEKDYCEEAELMLKEYEHRKTIQFKEELQFINGWVNDSTEASLLITGPSISGKKTLLYQFLKQNEKLHPNWLFICHFASMTPLYSNILHKTMVTLRNYFKIEQKVDINDEKLRRYFKYWLEVTSDFLQKQYLGYNRQQVPKVIIVLEGIDLCLDSKGNYVQPQFWLPSTIPSNIKLILTAKDNENFAVNNSIVLRHQITQDKREKIMRTYCERVLQFSSKNKELSLYFFYVINEMIKRKDHFKINKTTLQEVIKEYITHISVPDLNQDSIKSLLYTLILTRKGLKSKEICKIVNIAPEKWEYFYRCFSFLIVESKGYFLICNRPAIKVIQKIVDSGFEKVRLYRSSIVKVIKRESVHLRSLQEIVFQLMENESFCELKEVICRMQNFIMLYTPFSKELLCQCWSKLEQLQQFDPVFEYNKAIESYASHYYPKEEELYKIIFQICMFFKQYAEFQNSKTPSFRHPLIKGEIDHLESIGIYEELNHLNMIGKCKVYKMKPLDKMISMEIKPDITFSKVDSKDQKDKLDPTKTRHLEKRSMALRTQQESRTFSVKSRRSQKKLQQERQDISTPQSQEINREEDIEEEQKGLNVEELNIGIASNQDKFRHHFLGEMKQYLENYIVPLKKSTHKEKSLAFESDQSEGEEQTVKERGAEREFKVDIQKIKDSFILKNFKEYLEESYHKTGEEVQFYYYRQWIWLQFPWLCQTIRHVYSKMLKECLPGSINFMSPQKEFNLIKDVIKIARSAKETKLGIYTQKKIEIHCIKSPSNKYESINSGKVKQSNIRASGPITGRNHVETGINNQYKVHLSSLDQEIYKEKLEEAKLKERGFGERKTLRGDNSLPNLFMTEAGNKESRMFPSLKKSKFFVQPVNRGSKGEKENSNQDSRSFTQMIRKLNEIKHENQILVEKIEESKRLQMQKSDKSKEDMIEIAQNLEDLEVKKQTLQKNHKNQIELRKKLEVIIKICDLNKMYGSETDYLSNYLDNIKKMIELEDSKIKSIKNKIYSDVQQAKLMIRDLKAKKKQLKAIKDQILPPYNSVDTDKTNKHGHQMDLSLIEEELKDMSRVIKNKSTRKGKSTGFKHFYSARDYDILEIDLGIQYGEGSNQQKIQQFADKNEKLKELRLKNTELSKEYQEKKKNIELMQNEEKTQLKGESRERQIRNANLLVEKRKELNRIKNRCQLLIHAKSALQPIQIQ